MEFGKLSNIENIDFALPPDKSENERILRGGLLRRADALPHIYVGCTGWSMKEWIGKVYPIGAKSNDFVVHYGRQFNTIEMNTTHYRTPTLSDIHRWKNAVPPDFKFAPKMLQLVSHSNDFGAGTGRFEVFAESLLGLEEKLGVCFMQLPPHFDFKKLSNLDVFLKKAAKILPLAVEVRHEEWFENENAGQVLFDMLENYGVSTVITDVAGRRDVLHQRLTTPSVCIRFVGNDLHPSDYMRIDEWVLKLKEWCAMGLNEVYFFTHEPDNIKAPMLAQYFVRKVSENFGAILRGPSFFDTQQQMSLF